MDATDLTSVLEDFYQRVQKFKTLVKALGTYADSKKLREELRKERDEVNDLQERISSDMEHWNPNDLSASLGMTDLKRIQKFLEMRNHWLLLHKESLDKEKYYNSVPSTIGLEGMDRSPLGFGDGTVNKNVFAVGSEGRVGNKDRDASIDKELDRRWQSASDENFPPIEAQKIQKLAEYKYNSKNDILREIAEDRNKEINNIKNEVTQLSETFTISSKLVKQQGNFLDDIEYNVDNTQLQTRDAINVLAAAAKEQVVSWPISGAAIGGIIGGGIGIIMGPVGAAIGGTAGATLGSYLGQSAEQIQKDIVDKELIEHHLKEKWVPDERAKNCGICGQEFTQLLRRHHCRTCGGVFCYQCSSKKLPLKLLNTEKEYMERACDRCYSKHWNLI